MRQQINPHWWFSMAGPRTSTILPMFDSHPGMSPIITARSPSLQRNSMMFSNPLSWHQARWGVMPNALAIFIDRPASCLKSAVGTKKPSLGGLTRDWLPWGHIVWPPCSVSRLVWVSAHLLMASYFLKSSKLGQLRDRYLVEYFNSHPSQTPPCSPPLGLGTSVSLCTLIYSND